LKVIEIEKKGYIDERTASVIKTLILEENYDVFCKFRAYTAHQISDSELGHRLIRLAGEMSPYCERPQSPLPKRKQELMNYVNSLARYCF